ncbi:hypothetical protein CBM2633_P160004 [Cupriavidus taiwanensis]|uniref:Uncharacterized protein n=2 Tax=Cupriavidus taiwanensis TaxID=164546 RepID=A0A375GQF5_9BURK|nr:hypothetical protein CBM2588_P180004 [Cupriavidus taiwanensis]SOY74536.1 hypothetical protein CBM2592_P190003 [Cupriavidus taiwanensis]SOY74540.1 hypothetical protein CBM2585_P160004 [Cupriavidus taiwanensis]SOY77468.1 hypothetical protein CBM2586_P160003 [Cupriavidus taiwanensis]SOZ01741.1 hypothetical protein CBM2600_P160003 [Cupriavidus taiwanensis]
MKIQHIVSVVHPLSLENAAPHVAGRLDRVGQPRWRALCDPRHRRSPQDVAARMVVARQRVADGLWPVVHGKPSAGALCTGIPVCDRATALMHAMTDCLPVGYCLASQFSDKDGAPCLPPRTATLGRGAGVEEATSLNAWRQLVKACRSSHLDGDSVGHCGTTAQ